MPISDRKVPNNPLNGAELKQLVLTETQRLLAETEEQLLSALTGGLNNQSVFSPHYAHPRVAVSLSLKFHWSNRHLPETEISVTAGEGNPPLEDAKDDDQFVSGTDRKVTVDNPNLTRLDAGIPITVTEVERPGPGETVGSVQQRELQVDAGEYPKPTPPEDTDTTEELAAKIDVPENRRLRPPKKRGR